MLCLFTIFTKSHNAVRALCLGYQNVKMANLVCLLWEKNILLCPSYSAKAPTTYIFDFWRDLVVVPQTKRARSIMGFSENSE